MNIKILGAHNCESQNTRFTTLLVDETLALDAGGLVASLTFSAQQKLKAVLLTHQHYDHTKDIPSLAMDLYLSKGTIDIYSTLPVYNSLAEHLFDGDLYPNFLEFPRENPVIKYTVLEPLQARQIEAYSVLPLPVKHSTPTVGYQVTSSDDKVMFYTGDTGMGLKDCWEQISPQLLIIELTSSNRFEGPSLEKGHLTPDLLKHELINFREIKNYLPQIVTVHMDPFLEEEIKAEISDVAKELGHPITLGCEGMELNL